MDLFTSLQGPFAGLGSQGLFLMSSTVILLIIALQCGLWTYLKRCEEAADAPRSTRRRAAHRSEPQRATSASKAARSAPASEA